MSIAAFRVQKNIAEIVHFTTNKGLLGTFLTGALLPRSMLAEHDLLEFILKYNAARRTDDEWFGRNSLSVNEINDRFWDIQSRKHGDIWWCILSFDPVILEHDDVWFATTNNAYPGVKRAKGLEGLERIYADEIEHGWNWPKHTRKGVRECDPTCRQAEVLYPGPLPSKYLRKIYVATETEFVIASSYRPFMKDGPPEGVEVVIAPERFEVDADRCKKK